MTLTVHKYPLQPQHRNTLYLPQSARILTAQEQHGDVTLWALLDPAPDVVRSPRTFATYYTGTPIPDQPGQYIGTVQLHHGSTVIHVFEESASVGRDSGVVV